MSAELWANRPGRLRQPQDSALVIVLEPAEVLGGPATCHVVVRDQSVSVNVEDMMKMANAISAHDGELRR